MNKPTVLAAAAVTVAALSVAASRRWMVLATANDEEEEEYQIASPGFEDDRKHSDPPQTTGFDIKCTMSRSKGGTAPLCWASPNGGFMSSVVTELDIGGCSLFELPAAVGSMVSLRKLNAAKNLLASLPDEVSNLKQLRVAFFLGCNFEVVPEVLGTLPNLFMLSFKANRLRSVPERALSPSICWLILSDNKLASLPDSIGSLAGLRKLMLAGNALTHLPASLSRCTNLELVRLADNRLESVPSALLKLPKLAWLALASNAFNQKPLTTSAATTAADGTSPSSSSSSPSFVLGEDSVFIDPKSVLGNGASGVVFKGTLAIDPAPSAPLSPPSSVTSAPSPQSSASPPSSTSAPLPTSASSSSSPGVAIPQNPLNLFEERPESPQAFSAVPPVLKLPPPASPPLPTPPPTPPLPPPCHLGVAVKLFRAGKTSDGDPADEMAATAVAGAAGCPHLMKSFGVLEPQVAAKAAAEAEAEEAKKLGGGLGQGGLGLGGAGGDLGLVLELLDGYTALGGPPSFSSVSRDVYPGEDGSTGVDPLTGECSQPSLLLKPSSTPPPPISSSHPLSAAHSRLATLSFVLGVLRSVAWAASTLHSKGICHGDLYAHNILLKPTSKSTNRCGDEGNQEKKGAACVEGENKDEIEEGQEEEGFAVLSDLGAATFYKQNAGAGVASKAGEDEAAQLVERIEVLAFGYLVGELLDRCAQARGDPAQPATAAAAAVVATTSLRALASGCCGPIVSERPPFSVVLKRVRDISDCHRAPP